MKMTGIVLYASLWLQALLWHFWRAGVTHLSYTRPVHALHKFVVFTCVSGLFAPVLVHWNYKYNHPLVGTELISYVLQYRMYKYTGFVRVQWIHCVCEKRGFVHCWRVYWYTTTSTIRRLYFTTHGTGPYLCWWYLQLPLSNIRGLRWPALMTSSHFKNDRWSLSRVSPSWIT